jgi:hypothetical protein
MTVQDVEQFARANPKEFGEVVVKLGFQISNREFAEKGGAALCTSVRARASRSIRHGGADGCVGCLRQRLL